MTLSILTLNCSYVLFRTQDNRKFIRIQIASPPPNNLVLLYLSDVLYNLYF